MAGIRLCSVDGRAMLESGGRVIDVEKRSGGKFGSDPMSVFTRWTEFHSWAANQSETPADPLLSSVKLGLCVPRPRAVFGIGVNYQDHVEEAKLEMPKVPMVFTKFPSCLAAHTDDIPLTSNRVDWEAELVVVMAKGGYNIKAADAMGAIAGFTCGQDISDRRAQFSDKPPQFSLGKSGKAFGPIGPWVVSLDAFANPQDLAIGCDINGESMQSSRTSKMLFSIPQLIEYVSKWVELAPGDLLFTGTPAGVGSVRDPRRYLAAGELITTRIEGIGEMNNRCVALA
jgi:2,4-didehydro-3-deoxy-L-rhamnonate hydrolase